MADIEMLGGSDFHMDHGIEKASQHGKGEGGIDMYGGSDFHMGMTPTPSAQHGKGGSGLDMIGLQGLVSPSANDRLYGETKPTDKGTE